MQEFINTLPRNPEALPIIIIKAPNQNVNLTANRFHILNALQFLKRHNPEYKDIQISITAANLYPEDSNSPVNNIPSFYNEKEAGIDQTNDDDEAEEDDNLAESVAPLDVPTSSINEHVRASILEGGPMQPESLKWPTRSEIPASEWETGYFSRCFPNLFPFGTGDITKPRIGKNPQFLPYIKHLTRLPNTGFNNDPRFILHALSMYRRHKACTLGNVYAKNICRNMTLSDLKEKVAENDPSIMKSLIAFSAQIQGTRAYFKHESGKSVAFEKWIRIHSEGEEGLNLFLTFSLPDRHIPELHRLFPNSDQYLSKIVVKDIKDIPSHADPSQYIDSKTDEILRSKALNENGHIVDWFGKRKLDLMIEEVLKKTLGVVDYIVRSEYQSRKAIHWHMVARVVGISMKEIVRACKKYEFDVRDTNNKSQVTKEEQHAMI